jgi:hypothetical protein
MSIKSDSFAFHQEKIHFGEESAVLTTLKLYLKIGFYSG